MKMLFVLFRNVLTIEPTTMQVYWMAPPRQRGMGLQAFIRFAVIRHKLLYSIGYVGLPGGNAQIGRSWRSFHSHSTARSRQITCGILYFQIKGIILRTVNTIQISDLNGVKWLYMFLFIRTKGVKFKVNKIFKTALTCTLLLDLSLASFAMASPETTDQFTTEKFTEVQTSGTARAKVGKYHGDNTIIMDEEGNQSTLGELKANTNVIIPDSPDQTVETPNITILLAPHNEVVKPLASAYGNAFSYYAVTTT